MSGKQQSEMIELARRLRIDVEDAENRDLLMRERLGPVDAARLLWVSVEAIRQAIREERLEVIRTPWGVRGRVDVPTRALLMWALERPEWCRFVDASKVRFERQQRLREAREARQTVRAEQTRVLAREEPKPAQPPPAAPPPPPPPVERPAPVSDRAAEMRRRLEAQGLLPPR